MINSENILATTKNMVYSGSRLRKFLICIRNYEYVIRGNFMAKYLVIVESPAKVKTIKKFLGANYEVLASNGHVRDLPKSQMGIDIEHDYEPKYITIRGKGDVLANLRKLVKKSDKIYLAIVGSIAFYVAWKVVGNLYDDGLIYGSTIGKIIHWPVSPCRGAYPYADMRNK